MKKITYQQQLDAILSKIENDRQAGITAKRQRLLLHACCAPCSSYVIEYLSSYFDITVYYYNPNIHPLAEYHRRLLELERFLTQFPQAVQTHVNLIAAPYNPDEYNEATNILTDVTLQKEPERGERCRRCYLFRMKKAALYASCHGYDWFTTTLSISPYKDADKVNTIGRVLEQELNNSSLHFLPSDFKKRNGFLRSLQISAEYGMYRQDYCGCIYSKLNMQEHTTTSNN